LDSETGSEVVESESKVDTGSEASFGDLDSADEDLDSADGSLDSEEGSLDSEEGLDSEGLDLDGGGYWSGSDD
jgi:hypothetical protein